MHVLEKLTHALFVNISVFNRFQSEFYLLTKQTD